MNAIQLEFNFKNETEEDLRLHYMKMQIELMNQSLDKTRRRLFAEMGELRKTIHQLKEENCHLREKIMNYSGEKFEWNYECDDCLFDLKEN